MAELRGLPVSSSNISHGFYNAFPQFQTEYDGGGNYYGFLLSRDRVITETKRELKLRPTGPSGSGPYFHAVKSGRFGVRSACNTTTGYQLHLIHECDYESYQATGSNSMQYSRLYSDGVTCFAIFVYYLKYEGQYHGRGYLDAYTIADKQTLPAIGRYSRATGWYYQIPNVSEAIFGQTIDLLSDLAWSVLSGASGDHVDPVLHKTVSQSEQIAGADVIPIKSELEFKYDELACFGWWDVTGVLEGRYRTMAGQAFYNAASEFPKSEANSIANVLELAQSISHLVHGEFGKLKPSNAREAWLMYRYQYSTSKADLADYQELTKRLIALASMPLIYSDGNVRDGNISCHCKIGVNAGAIIPSDTRSWLETYGFKASWYNIWDMIPYSFVVDWFLHVGDIIQILESDNWAYSLPITTAWTSFSTTYQETGQSNYFRVPGYFRCKCPFLDYTQSTPSGKTIAKRVADSIALFT